MVHEVLVIKRPPCSSARSVWAGSRTGETATTPRTLGGNAGSAHARSRKLPPNENPARYNGRSPQRAAIARSAPVTSLRRQE